MLFNSLSNNFSTAETAEDLKEIMEQAKSYLGVSSYSLFSIPFVTTNPQNLYSTNQIQSPLLNSFFNFTGTRYITNCEHLITNIDSRYFLNDPRFHICHTQKDRYFWDLNMLRNYPNFVQLMSSNGIFSGMTIPYLDANTRFCLMHYHFEKLSIEEIKMSAGNLRWLSEMVHSRFSQLIGTAKYARHGNSRNEPHLSEFLTPREIQICTLLCEGYTTKNIAQELTLSVSMVQRHIDSAKCKLGSRNRTELTFRFKKSLLNQPSTAVQHTDTTFQLTILNDDVI